MKSVGEAMAIGRSFPEALQKALRSLESNHAPFGFEQEPRADAADRLLSEAATSRTTAAWNTIHRALQAGCQPGPGREGQPVSIPGSSSRSITSTRSPSRSGRRRRWTRRR